MFCFNIGDNKHVIFMLIGNTQKTEQIMQERRRKLAQLMLFSLGEMQMGLSIQIISLVTDCSRESLAMARGEETQTSLVFRWVGGG